MDTNILGQFQVTGVYSAIPVVLITLNAGLRQVFSMSSKYAILINWIGGVALGIALKSPETMIVHAGIIGFFAGSAASGLYDGMKQYLKEEKEVIPPIEQ